MGVLSRILSDFTLSERAVTISPNSFLTNLGFPTAAGRVASKKESSGLPAVYHAIDLISSDYASIPQLVYEGNKKRDDHNITYLINFQPNRYQTPFEFKRMRAVHRLVFGNSFTIINRDTNELIPVHPEKVTQIWEHNGGLWYQIHGVDQPIHMDDMLHVKDMNTDDDWFGKSRIDICREAFGAGLAMRDFTSSYFGNGAHISLVLETELGSGDLTSDPKQRESLERSLRDKYTGQNSHKSIVLPPGLKLSTGPTRFNPEQSQFIQSRIHFVEEVAQIFNLPLSKMRIKTDGNSYNSQEQANIEYITDCLVPFSQGFKEEDNRKLFMPNEIGRLRIRNLFENRLKGDMKTQGEFIDKMVKNGVYSVNNALEFLGMDVIGEEGDLRYINGAQMKLGQTNVNETNENNQE